MRCGNLKNARFIDPEELLGDVGTQIDRREMSVFKLFSQLRQANSVALRVLSAVLIISIGALVYKNDVYAYSTLCRLYFSGRLADTLDNAVNYCVYPASDSQLTLLNQSAGSYYSSNNNIYDLSIPVYLSLDDSYSNGTYSVSIYILPGVHIIPDQDVTFIGAYADTTEFFSFSYVGSGGTPQILKKGVGESLTSRIEFFDMPFRMNYSNIFYIHYYFQRYVPSSVNPGGGSSTVPVNFKVWTPYYFGLSDIHITADNTVVGGLQDIQDTIEKEHQEEIDKGESSGSDASDMVGDLTDQVRSKWEILFYPIEFTKNFLALFSSSSSGSTSLVFPSFSLDIDGRTYQVWDSYTYDLSELQSNFGALFTGLHMVVGTIEVGAFVKYLYGKYDEVFGGGASS